MGLRPLGLVGSVSDATLTKASNATPGATSRPPVGDVDFYVHHSSATPDHIAYADTRAGIVIQNLSTTQTLKVGESSTGTNPGSYTDVAPGLEWASATGKHVFAYFPTSDELVRVVVYPEA